MSSFTDTINSGLEIIGSILEEKDFQNVKVYLEELHPNNEKAQAEEVYRWCEALNVDDSRLVDFLEKYDQDALIRQEQIQSLRFSAREQIILFADADYCGLGLAHTHKERYLDACDTLAEMGELDVVGDTIEACKKLLGQIRYNIDRAWACIDAAAEATEIGEFDANDQAFYAWLGWFDDLGMGYTVDRLSESYTAAINHSKPEAWQSPLQLVTRKYLIPVGDGYFAVRFPKTHRIELEGMVKGKTVTQKFKSIIPQVWADSWVARIVAIG